MAVTSSSHELMDGKDLIREQGLQDSIEEIVWVDGEDGESRDE